MVIYVVYIDDCTVCGNAYKTRATIANHVVIHVVHIYNCAMCLKAFKNRATIAYHVELKCLPEEEVELTPLLLSAERSGPLVGLEGEGAGSGPQRYRTSSRRWS